MFDFLRNVFAPRQKTVPVIGNTGPLWGGGLGVAYPGNAGYAENVAAVAACTNLIASTIAALPAQIFTELPNGNREPASDHPLQRIIDNGSGGVTWADMTAAWLADALLHGNGAYEILTSATGRLTGLGWLPWSRMGSRLSDGVPLYSYSTPGAGLRNFIGDDLVLLRDRLDPAMPWLGGSRLRRSPGVIALAGEISFQHQKLTANTAKPGGTLTAPGKISDETARRLREDFDQSFAGSRVGKTAVLGEGLEFKPTANSAVEAQFVERLLWSLQECARLYNVPPQLIGDLSASTFTNSAQAARSLAVFCLAPWVRKIEATFNQSVLAAPYSLSVDLSELMRGDTETYFRSLALFRNSAVISANEARVLTGFGKHADADADKLVAVQHGSGPDSQPSGDKPGGDGEQPGAKPKKGLRLAS